MGARAARLGLVLSCGAIVACKKPPPPAPPAQVVRVATVQARSVPLIKEWLASVDGFTTAQIQPQVTGYIREVNYREGTMVEAEQLLFTLDRRPFIAALDKARGDHESAVAQLDKARQDVRRYIPLVAQNALSREQLDNARAAVLQGEGNVQSTRGALAAAKINLAWTEVRSPIAGLVGLAQTRVGTLVSPSQVLTVVSSLDPMRASFNVSQQEYLQYSDALSHPNAPRYAAQRYFELILVNGLVYPQRANEVIVNRQIDPTTGTLLVQALFPNPGHVLRPGLFGKVRIHAGVSHDVPVVPERAVTELQGQYQVAVVDEQQRVQLRTVKVGAPTDHAYVVESGLRPGERVIVEGQQNILPGAKVSASEIQPGERRNVSGHDAEPDGGAD
ncbi:MAG TPA: efflux RND transporter periplasmic adaptor subunit [Polyangia bacterium]|nr:efflux RND transporter periplasmic adaptor subunit [Polyangia bacterium]